MADESTIFLDSSPEEDNDDGKDDDYLPPSKVKKVPAKRKPRKAAQCKPVAVIDLVQSPIVVTLVRNGFVKFLFRTLQNSAHSADIVQDTCFHYIRAG